MRGSGEELVEELTQSQVKEFTRKQKGDKKMKHRKRDPGSGISSSKSNISRKHMRGRIPKIPNVLAIRKQVRFRRANILQFRPQLQPLQRNNHNDNQIEIAAAHFITALIAHLPIRQLQRHLKDHVERVMLKTSSRHSSSLLIRYKTLRTNNQSRSISPQE